MDQTNIPSILCGGKLGCNQTHTCALTTVVGVRSLPLSSRPLLWLSLLLHIFKTPGKQTQAMKEWDGLYWKWNWNWTGLNHALFLWHHCNNFPFAGTLCCLCVLWVMCCNPKTKFFKNKKKEDMTTKPLTLGHRASVKKRKKKRFLFSWKRKPDGQKKE